MGLRRRRTHEGNDPGLYLGPQVPRRPRRRRFHLAALLAAAVYFAGAYVAYELYQAAWHDEERVAGPAADGAGAAEEPAAEEEAPSTESQDRAALRALAARAQESVFVVETTGPGQRSGFVAWVMDGDSYVLTAHLAVAAVLEAGGSTVFVRRGSEIRTGEIIREHRANGLALIRVQGELGRPLWQERGAAERLQPGGIAFVVPAGSPEEIAEGTAAPQERGRIAVQAPGAPISVGAPVLGADGRLAGVVTDLGGGGVRVVPIEGACEAEIRRCV